MKQLSQYLRSPFLNFFMVQLGVAKEDTRDSPKKYLWQFQNHLRGIKDWNIEKMKNEIKAIEIASNCDFLEELITAVFIAHTKVMTAIRISSRKNKINITVPKLEHYLFKALCECSDLLWANTYLFRDDISAIEKQKNMRLIEQLVSEGMQQAIRALLPVKSILKDLVPDEDEQDDVDVEADDTEDAVDTKEEVAVVSQIVPLAPAFGEPAATTIIPSVSESDPLTITETADGTRHFEGGHHIVHTPEPVSTGVVVNKASANSVDTTPVTTSISSGVVVNKMSAQDSGIVEQPEHILLTADPLIDTELNDATDIPFMSGPIEEIQAQQPQAQQPQAQQPQAQQPQAPKGLSAIPEQVHKEPLIFQVDTSKKVQFSDYNMGVSHDEDGFIEPMGNEENGAILMDECEQPIGADDFETL